MDHILLFTKTTEYRHESIADGVRLIHDRAAAAGVSVDHTEDETVFRAATLEQYSAVVWLQVCGDVLDEQGREGFAAYLRSGGGYAGVHGAAVAERSWPAYEEVVGARFRYHPKNGRQSATLRVEGGDHESTRSLPTVWQWTDEWYAFARNPRGVVTVLLTVDEATYDPEEQPMGDDHPVSWCRRFGEGRTWYTALGHHAESYADRAFRDHIWGGITSVFRRP